MHIFAIVMAVVSLAMTVYAMANMPNLSQDDFGSELPDSGATQELNFVYGQARIQCNKVFEDVAAQGRPDANEGDWLSIVAVAGQGPFNTLKQIYINGSPLLKPVWLHNMKTTHATCGVIGKEFIEDRFANHVQIQFNMGQKNYFYSMINQMHPNKWDNTCVGNGIASVALKILRDPYKGEIQGSPQIEVEVEGRLVRDVRMSSTEPAYHTSLGTIGTNPALCILDYLTSPHGAGVSWDDIDEYSFASMANVYDKFDYRINGVVKQGNSIKMNLMDLQSDFHCAVTKPMNKWSIISWTPDVVDVELTEDDILEKDIEVIWGSSKSAFNRLEVEYQDAANQYQKDILVYPTLTNDELINKYGSVVTKKVEAKFTTRKEQVDRLASILYESTRNITIVKLKGNEKAYDCQVGDIVQLTHEKFKLNKKLFKVMTVKRSTSVNETGTAELILAEYTRSAFDTHWESNKSGAVVLPNTIVNPPRNLRFDVAAVGDTFTGCLRWDRASCSDFLEYVVEYKLSSQPESEWQHYGRTQNSEMYLFNLHGAYYDFRVFTRTKFMKTSAFAELYKVDVKDDTILPKVLNLKLVTSNKDKGITDTEDFIAVWDSMDDVPVQVDLQMLPNATGYQTVKTVKKGYEVEIYHGTEYRRTVFSPDAQYRYSFSDNQLDGLSRYVTFKVKIVSKGGAKSRESAVLVAKNRQHQEPSGVIKNGDNAGIHLQWDKSRELDVAGTNVYVSKTKGFKPTGADIPKNLIVTSNFFFMPSLDGTWYVRIAHYDVFGTDELVYSPEYELTALSALHQMTDLNKGLEKEMMDKLKSTDLKLGANIEAAKKEMDTALKSVDAKLQLEVKDRSAAVAKVQGVVDTNASKAAADLTVLRTEMNTKDSTLQANIDKTNKALVDKEKAIAESIAKTEVKLNDKIQAEVKTITTAYTAADKALASQSTTIQSNLDKTNATVQTQANTIADINGKLRAEMYLKVNADGKFAGIGLIADKGTNSSKLIFTAEQLLFVDPSDKVNKPFMEYRNGKLMVRNAMIDDLSAANIRAGSITAACIAANTITSNHITANVQLNTPQIIMPNSRIGDGHAGFGTGGPYSAWGQTWNTLIAPDGTIYTNKLQASAGKIANMQIQNCVITEDCHVNGFLYANKIIGMPTGKRFGLGEVGIPLYGGWMDVAVHQIDSPRGRFETMAQINVRGNAVGVGFYGVKNMEAARGGNFIAARILLNGNEIWREMITNTPQGDHNFHTSLFTWSSIMVNVGAYGGELKLQFSTVSWFRAAPGRETSYDWNTGPRFTNRPYNILVSSLDGAIFSAIDK